MGIQRDTDYKPVEGIPLRSPLAFGGFFLHFLRTRFREGMDAPYTWLADDTKTEIFIISGQTIENEIRNNRPAVYVNIGQVRENSIVIGDRADAKLNIDTEGSYSRLDMGVTINCESPNKGESHALGWLVFSALVAAKDVIRTKYHIANFGSIDLLPPRPSKKDRETYISTVNLGINYELTWKVTAVQTFIKEIGLTMDIKKDEDPTSFLIRIYLESIGKTN